MQEIFSSLAEHTVYYMCIDEGFKIFYSFFQWLTMTLHHSCWSKEIQISELEEWTWPRQSRCVCQKETCTVFVLIPPNLYSTVMLFVIHLVKSMGQLILVLVISSLYILLKYHHKYNRRVGFVLAHSFYLNCFSRVNAYLSLASFSTIGP